MLSIFRRPSVRSKRRSASLRRPLEPLAAAGDIETERQRRRRLWRPIKAQQQFGGLDGIE